MRTRSEKVLARIFSMTRARCSSTVRVLSSSSAAISLLSLPVTTRSMTWRSRRVRVRARAAISPRCAAWPAACEQRVVLERLLDEVEDAGLHGAHRDAHVAVPGHDDGRHAAAAPLELGEEVDSAHAGHAQ